MPNEPAEDRSVRGNTIKPAKVEPEQRISGEYLDGELGLKSTRVQNVRVGFNSDQKLIDTGVPNERDVFSVHVVHSNNDSDVIYHGETPDGVDHSGDEFGPTVEYATLSGDDEFGLSDNFHVLIHYTSTSAFSNFDVNVLHF
jgi:hypothetical protein